MHKYFLFTLLALFSITAVAQSQSAPSRWSVEKANSWYQQQPWLVGSNYTPATAINQLEMWQAESFDPQQIDKELGWAEGLGMNTMRVFLHDLLWQQDPAGFKKRIDAFLTIADKHHIRPIFVLFDSCWDPLPRLGPQHPPIPGYTIPDGCKARESSRWRTLAIFAAAGLCKGRGRRIRQ